MLHSQRYSAADKWLQCYWQRLNVLLSIRLQWSNITFATKQFRIWTTSITDGLQLHLFHWEADAGDALLAPSMTTGVSMWSCQRVVVLYNVCTCWTFAILEVLTHSPYSVLTTVGIIIPMHTWPPSLTCTPQYSALGQCDYAYLYSIYATLRTCTLCTCS